jgi:hypothetical protein
VSLDSSQSSATGARTIFMLPTSARHVSCAILPEPGLTHRSSSGSRRPSLWAFPPSTSSGSRVSLRTRQDATGVGRPQLTRSAVQHERLRVIYRQTDVGEIPPKVASSGSGGDSGGAKKSQ